MPPIVNVILRSMVIGLVALLVQGEQCGSQLWYQLVSTKLSGLPWAADRRCDRQSNRVISQLRYVHDGGFALVTALWVSALLGLLSMNLLREGGATKMLAVTNMARLQAEAVADGAINTVILKLFDPMSQASVLADDIHFKLENSEIDFIVRTERESGKINLNTASLYLLFTLFRHMGATANEAEMIAAGIIDWRTPLSEVHSDSLDLAYLKAERPYGPRRGAFRAIAELRLVLGMTDALQVAVAPLLTIWSNNAAVDCNLASDAVLEVLAAAEKGLSFSERFNAGELASRGCSSPSDANGTMTITARIVSSKLFVERQAIVRFSKEQRKSFAILDWH